MTEPTSFAELTTLRLGGPIDRLLEVTREDDLIEAVRGTGHLLVVGGGSNLVVADVGYRGTVVLVRTQGVAVHSDGDAQVRVTVQAGENWDDLVARAVRSGWVGIEALSGIPGSVGATPIQNVGAYGQEVADTIVAVEVFDRVQDWRRTFTPADLDFGYRSSRFKAESERYVVLSVTFRLAVGEASAPIRYAELARALGVEVGERAPLAQVREAVLTLRASKGMVVDPYDADTWSAGSFFTNPFVMAAPEGAPAYPQPDGRLKTSAAWLIDQAGFTKGYTSPAARGVSVSTKHTLALTNRGGAKTSALLALAAEIQRGVYDRFGIWLEPEPTLVGVSLPGGPQ